MIAALIAIALLFASLLGLAVWIGLKQAFDLADAEDDACWPNCEAEQPSPVAGYVPVGATPGGLREDRGSHAAEVGRG